MSLPTTRIHPDVCECGRLAIEGRKKSLRYCESCRIEWYVNHCWSCNPNGTFNNIDGRFDKRMNECCSWFACPDCGVCGMDCPRNYMETY